MCRKLSGWKSLIIEPYQHEPVEDQEDSEDASSEDSMSDDESNAYEDRLNNINW